MLRNYRRSADFQGESIFKTISTDILDVSVNVSAEKS